MKLMKDNNAAFYRHIDLKKDLKDITEDYMPRLSGSPPKLTIRT